MDILEEILMTLVTKAQTWLMLRLGKWWNTRWPVPLTHGYLDILGKLRVIHKSEHFLAVNKHPDLVINTNPPDTR